MNTLIDDKRLREIIYECIEDMFQKKQRLDEMARVGFMNDLEVIVYTDDRGYIPHVHIIDRATKGQDFDTCIRLDKADYFLHGRHNDVLNSNERKDFNAFMNQPSRNVHYRNNYEAAVNLWNDNNSNSYVQIIDDKDGNVVVPDYTKLNAI
jgi:hypothetical protein